MKNNPSHLQCLHIKRVNDEVDVMLLPHKDGSGYSFVNLTQGHICPCVFPTIEDALLDLAQQKEVLSWDHGAVSMISAKERMLEAPEEEDR